MPDNGSSQDNDFLGDDPEPTPHVPTLNDLLADNLTPNDLVVIDNEVTRFTGKEPRGGPHVFWSGERNTVVKLFTHQILEKLCDGTYIRPTGSDTPSVDAIDALSAAEKERLRLTFGAVRARPRKKAQVKWLYVTYFQTQIDEHRARGELFAKNEDNAIAVTAKVDELLRKHNMGLPPHKHLVRPDCIQPRTVLSWIEKESKRKLGEVGQVHLNALKEHPRKADRQVLEIIGQMIAKLARISGKFTPTQIRIAVDGAIDEYNTNFNKALAKPTKSLVYEEYCRFDAWRRLMRSEGVKSADLEYGAVGKLPRPRRILDLAELDHHKFDMHPVLRKLSFGPEFPLKGIDRFWVCLMLDVHSGYPLGFQLSFEPGGLLPALACIDHGVRMKDYVARRWPDINGALLGYGKPVRIRYDNAKEFVGIQLAAALARVQIGFALSIPRVPNSKPFVERFFGSLERDFIQWLMGATGANVQKKGEGNPVDRARVSCNDFEKLFHIYLIEVYARRPQEDLGNRSPEEVWMEGLAAANTRPRSLTKAQSEQMDVIASIEVDVLATREGCRWGGNVYQSTELQKLRRHSGYAGYRETDPTPLHGRIPLKDVGKLIIADPDGLREGKSPREIVVGATNPHAHGRTHWMHKAIQAQVRKEKGDPSNHADYERGFVHLLKEAARAMGVPIPNYEGGLKPRLTGGQAPRFTGIFLQENDKSATDRLETDLRRYNIFEEIHTALTRVAKPQEASPSVEAAIEEATRNWSNDPIQSDDDDDDYTINRVDRDRAPNMDGNGKP